MHDRDSKCKDSERGICMLYSDCLKMQSHCGWRSVNEDSYGRSSGKRWRDAISCGVLEIIVRLLNFTL